MKKEFVPFELAVKLKELGFKDRCLGSYDLNKDFYIGGSDYKINIWINAPLWQQAFDWFRVNHNLMGNAQYFINSYFCYTINNMEGKRDSNRLFTEYETYHEARQACLEKLIELVK